MRALLSAGLLTVVLLSPWSGLRADDEPRTRKEQPIKVINVR